MEGKIIGDQRLLTLSHFVDLEEKIIIKPGEEKTLGETKANFAVFPIGSFRVGLWVSVEGSTQNTQNTTIEFYHHCPGCGQNNSWKLNENIGSWTISGLDWNDHYISLNISKISPPPARFNNITNFKIKNTGNKTLEIFSYGIIQEVNSYVQN